MTGLAAAAGAGMVGAEVVGAGMVEAEAARAGVVGAEVVGAVVAGAEAAGPEAAVSPPRGRFAAFATFANLAVPPFCFATLGRDRISSAMWRRGLA